MHVENKLDYKTVLARNNKPKNIEFLYNNNMYYIRFNPLLDYDL